MILNQKEYLAKINTDLKYKVNADTVDVTKVYTQEGNKPHWDVRVGIDVERHLDCNPAAIIIHYLEELFKIVYANSSSGFEDDITESMYERYTRTFCLSSSYSYAPLKGSAFRDAYMIPFKLTIYLYHYSAKKLFTQENFCSKVGLKKTFLMSNIIAKDSDAKAKFDMRDLTIYFVDSYCNDSIKISSNAHDWDSVSYGFINSRFNNVMADAFVKNVALVDSEVILYADNFFTSSNKEIYLEEHCSLAQKFFYLCLVDARFTPDYFPTYRGEVIYRVKDLMRNHLPYFLEKVKPPYNSSEVLAKNTYIITKPESIVVESPVKDALYFVDNKSQLFHVNLSCMVYAIFSGCYVKSICFDNKDPNSAHYWVTDELNANGIILYEYPIPDFYYHIKITDEIAAQLKLIYLYDLTYGKYKDKDLADLVSLLEGF